MYEAPQAYPASEQGPACAVWSAGEVRNYQALGQGYGAVTHVLVPTRLPPLPRVRQGCYLCNRPPGAYQEPRCWWLRHGREHAALMRGLSPRRTSAREEISMSIPKALSPGEEAFALHCRAEFHPVHQPLREFRFHPERKWRFDFAWPLYQLAVEIEGRGRHQSFGGFEKDAEKYNAAAKLGW